MTAEKLKEWKEKKKKGNIPRRENEDKDEN